jgi:hypothetical protein
MKVRFTSVGDEFSQPLFFTFQSLRVVFLPRVVFLIFSVCEGVSNFWVWGTTSRLKWGLLPKFQLSSTQHGWASYALNFVQKPTATPRDRWKFFITFFHVLWNQYFQYIPYMMKVKKSFQFNHEFIQNFLYGSISYMKSQIVTRVQKFRFLTLEQIQGDS